MNAFITKRWLACLLTFLLATTAANDARGDSRPEVFASGEDWVSRMTPNEKVISLVPPAILFGSYDIRLRHSLPQYLPLMDSLMRENPQFANEDVTNIFASAIYAYEPESRPQFRAMELALLQGGAPLQARLRLEHRDALPDLLRPESEDLE